MHACTGILICLSVRTCLEFTCADRDIDGQESERYRTRGIERERGTDRCTNTHIHILSVSFILRIPHLRTALRHDTLQRCNLCGVGRTLHAPHPGRLLLAQVLCSQTQESQDMVLDLANSREVGSAQRSHGKKNMCIWVGILRTVPDGADTYP